MQGIARRATPRTSHSRSCKRIDNLQNYCLGTRYGARSRSRLCRRLSISLVRYRRGLEKFLEHHFIPIRRRFNPHDLPTDLLRVQDPFFFGEEGRSFRQETTVHGPQWGGRRWRGMSCSCAVVHRLSKAVSIFFFIFIFIYILKGWSDSSV